MVSRMKSFTLIGVNRKALLRFHRLSEVLEDICLFKSFFLRHVKIGNIKTEKFHFLGLKLEDQKRYLFKWRWAKYLVEIGTIIMNDSKRCLDLNAIHAYVTSNLNNVECLEGSTKDVTQLVKCKSGKQVLRSLQMTYQICITDFKNNPCVLLPSNS